MKSRFAYCSACDKQVRVVITTPPVHGGQASLPDSPQIVCLEFGDHCTGALCPAFGVSRTVMGVRLARSGLKQEGWKTITGPCDGCGHLVDLRIVDPTHAVCPDCGTTNRWQVLRVDDEDYVAIAGTE